MNLYQAYIKERANLEMLADETYFLTYKINGPECLIADMFIKESARNSSLCKDMIDEISAIAKERGCKALTANIGLEDPGRNRTMKAALKLGFFIADANQKAILIVKELGG